MERTNKGSGFFSRVNSLSGLNLSISYIQIAGYWKPDSCRGWKAFLYYFYTFLIFSSGLGALLVIQCIDFYIIWGDITLVASNSLLFFTNVVQFVKVINLIWNGKHIRIIYNKCKDFMKDVNDPGKSEIIKRYAIKSLKEVIYYGALTMFTVMIWTVSPILDPQSENRRDFPLKVWYSQGMTSPFFEMSYVHQSMSVIYLASLNVAKDTLFTGLVNQVECQLALLKYSLSHMTDDIEHQSTNPTQVLKHIPRKRYQRKNRSSNCDAVKRDQGFIEKNLAHYRNDLNILADEKVYEKLKECIVHHQDVMQLVDGIEKSFYLPTLAQFTLSLLIFCFTTYNLAVMININLMRVAAMCLYLSTMMVQLYIYCWHGNEIAILSTDVIGSAYECQWYITSSKFRKSLTTLMARSLQPARLSVGGFTTVSVETFVSIVKASYSFFTVLKQLQDPLKNNLQL